MPDSGAQSLGIYDRRRFGKNIAQQPRPTGGVTCTEPHLRVDDLGDAQARVLRAGARLLDPCRARDWSDEVAYFSDPDGNVIGLARALS